MQEQQEPINRSCNSAGTAPGFAAASRAAPAAACSPGSWHATVPKAGASKKKQRKRRLREVIDGEEDSDSDVMGSDDDEWQNKVRPTASRPLQPGATHIVIDAARSNPSTNTGVVCHGLLLTCL